MEWPKVSILMPIWNRGIFLPLIESNIKGLIYDDKSKLELCIDDDGDSKLFKDNLQIEEFEKRIAPVSLKYTWSKTRRSIGAKRNNLTFKMASNKIVANMDSDDIYMPSYLIYGISEMYKQNKKCVGSNQMVFVYPLDDWKITGIQCESKRQVHEACLIYTVKYARSMGGFKKNNQGEGSKMVDFNDKNVGLIDVNKLMICVCHNDNTIPKDIFKDVQVMGGNISDEYKIIINKILSEQI